MFDEMREMLARVDAEYADLRYEAKHETTVAVAGRDLTEASANSADGRVLRAHDRGGLAGVAFTGADGAEEAARTAVANARLLGASRPVELAPVEPVRDHARHALDEDPRETPLAEKVDLVRRLAAVPLAMDGIVHVDLAYREVTRERRFVSTEGAEVREDLVTCWVAGTIVAGDGALTQDVRFSAGGGDGFQHVRRQEERIAERARMAIDLLRAEPVTAGGYDCVLSPILAGVLAHEAFGHLSEADIVERRPGIRERMRIGARLGSEAASIVDDATPPGHKGHYRYDDEGVPVRRTELLREGVLVGRLHDRRTAALFGEPPTGHAVAEDYRYAPLVRMGTTYFEPGVASPEELLDRLGDGLYLVDPKGGQTGGESFTFGAQWGFEVKGGKPGRLLRDLNVSGNLYRTLRKVEAAANDLRLTDAGACGKGQMNVRSCCGAPHLLVRDLLVGGA